MIDQPELVARITAETYEISKDAPLGAHLPIDEHDQCFVGTRGGHYFGNK